MLCKRRERVRSSTLCVWVPTRSEKIDSQLEECGWIVQDISKADFSAGRGIILREVRLKTGPCDYLMFVDRVAVGVVEAKKEGTTRFAVAEQSTNCAENLPEYLAAAELPRLLDELNEALAA